MCKNKPELFLCKVTKGNRPKIKMKKKIGHAGGYGPLEKHMFAMVISMW